MFKDVRKPPCSRGSCVSLERPTKNARGFPSHFQLFGTSKSSAVSGQTSKSNNFLFWNLQKWQFPQVKTCNLVIKQLVDWGNPPKVGLFQVDTCKLINFSFKKPPATPDLGADRSSIAHLRGPQRGARQRGPSNVHALAGRGSRRVEPWSREI